MQQDASQYLPKITRAAQPNYSICQAEKMVGKTVAKVEYGFRKPIKGVHESEALIIHFTDGSVLGIDTGSNAQNVAADHKGLKPEEFHSDFMLQWA